MIYKERVISGQHLCRLVNDSLADIEFGETVVDLGAGSGRVVQAITQLSAESDVIGVEIDPELCYQGREAGFNFINADASHLPLKDESTDTVTAVNSFHEIAAHPSEEMRLALFETAAGEASRIMKLGGRLLMFDGFMPEDETQKLTLMPRQERAMDLLMRFDREYEARKPNISIRDSSPIVAETDLATATTLLTKLKYLIDARAWSGERQQLYPFASLDSITKAMQRMGLRIDSIDFPASNLRLGLRSLFGNFVISTAEGEVYRPHTFPACQVLLTATKIEGYILPVRMGYPE